MNKLEILSYIISNPNKILILKTLDKHKQRTIYDLYKEIPISYKNTHRSFKKLEDINCIKRATNEYGKRGTIPYELTERGIAMVKIIEIIEGLD